MDNNIKDIQPGPEMDAKVAEALGHKLGMLTDYGFKKDYNRKVIALTGNRYDQISRYFTTWEGMRLVLEHPPIMDRIQIGIYPTSFGKWIARPFMPGYEKCTVQADTEPEAVGKCVLLAMNGGEGNEEARSPRCTR